LLEAQLGVGDTYTELAGLWVPRDLGHGSLDSVGVLEDHDGLGGDWLRHELGILTLEILLKKVDFIVLLDAACGSLDKFAGSLAEAHCGLLSQFSHVLVNFVLLLVVVFLGPSTDGVSHAAVLSRHALSVNLRNQTIGKYKIKKWARLRLVRRFKKCNLRGARTSRGCCRG